MKTKVDSVFEQYDRWNKARRDESTSERRARKLREKEAKQERERQESELRAALKPWAPLIRRSLRRLGRRWFGSNLWSDRFALLEDIRYPDAYFGVYSDFKEDCFSPCDETRMSQFTCWVIHLRLDAGTLRLDETVMSEEALAAQIALALRNGPRIERFWPGVVAFTLNGQNIELFRPPRDTGAIPRAR